MWIANADILIAFDHSFSEIFSFCRLFFLVIHLDIYQFFNLGIYGFQGFKFSQNLKNIDRGSPAPSLQYKTLYIKSLIIF